MYYKIAHDVTKYLGYVCKKICHKQQKNRPIWSHWPAPTCSLTNSLNAQITLALRHWLPVATRYGEIWYIVFLKWAIPGLFLFIFVFSIQLTVNIQFNFLPMTGSEPQTYGIGSNRSTNWATTTAQSIRLLFDSCTTRSQSYLSKKIYLLASIITS